MFVRGATSQFILSYSMLKVWVGLKMGSGTPVYIGHVLSGVNDDDQPLVFVGECNIFSNKLHHGDVAKADRIGNYH